MYGRALLPAPQTPFINVFSFTRHITWSEAGSEPAEEIFEVAVRANVTDVGDEDGRTRPGGRVGMRSGGDARQTAGCGG